MNPRALILNSLTLLSIALLLFGVLACGDDRPTMADVQGVWIGVDANFFMRVDGNSVVWAGTPTPWIANVDGQFRPRFPPPSAAYPPRVADSAWISSSGAFVMVTHSNKLDTVGYLGRERDTLTIRDTWGSPSLPLRRVRRDTSLHLQKIQITYRAERIYDLQLSSSEMFLSSQSPDSQFFGRSFPSAEMFTKCELTVQEADFRGTKGGLDTLRPYADPPHISLAVTCNDTTRILFFHPGAMPAELSPMVPLLLGAMDSTFVPIDTSFVFLSRLRSCCTNLDSLEYMESISPSLFRPPRFPGGIARLEAQVRASLLGRIERRGQYSVDVTVDERGSIAEISDIDLLIFDDRFIPVKYLRAAELGQERTLFRAVLINSSRFVPALWNGVPTRSSLTMCIDFNH